MNTQLQDVRTQGPIPTIGHLVQQFTDNCSFLWLQRELVARAVTHQSNFEDLLELDDRIDAHLDALRCSGINGWEASAEALSLQGGGEVFAAAVLAFEGASTDQDSTYHVRLDSLFTAAKDIKDFVRPASVALHWVSAEHCRSALRWLFGQESDLCQAVALMGASMRGVDCRAKIDFAVQSDSDILADAGCRAAVMMSHRYALHAIEKRFDNDPNTATFAAIEAACLLGSNKAQDVLIERCKNDKSPFAERAASLLFRSIDPVVAVRTFAELFGTRVSRVALSAAAASGTSDLVRFILNHVSDKKYAKFASELFCMVVGVPIQQFKRKEAEAAEAVIPTDDPEDDNVALGPDHGRAPAEAELVSQWWHEHEGGFAPRTRYLNGQLVTPESLTELLRSGPQTYRGAAAELSALSRWLEPIFDVYAPAFRQRERLSGISWA